MVGRLGPFHEAGQAVGSRGRWVYRVVGLGLKVTVLTDTILYQDKALLLNKNYVMLC